MANYTVNVVNPRKKSKKKSSRKKASKRKTSKKKTTKRKSSKKKSSKKKSSKKKTTKKKTSKRKTSKRKTTKKKATKRKTKKKTSKRKPAKKKATKRKPAKKKATKRKPAKKKATKRKPAKKKATRRPVRTGGAHAFPRMPPTIAAAVGISKQLAQTYIAEIRKLQKRIDKLEKTRKKDRAEIKELESDLRSCKNRLGRARKRGDMSKKDEESLKDQVESLQRQLRACKGQVTKAKKAAKRKPAKKKATKRKTTKRKVAKRKTTKKKVAKRKTTKRKPARRRRPPATAPWPTNVPLPTMSVDEAIDRLSVAGRNMARGGSAPARRMQLSSQGYLQLNPLKDIPGHPGMVAQFKSPKSRRARAVAADAKSALRKPKPKMKNMSAREKASILRRITKI